MIFTTRGTLPSEHLHQPNVEPGNDDKKLLTQTIYIYTLKNSDYLF